MDHQREEGKRTLASTAKAIEISGNFIGGDIKRQANPKFIEERGKLWDTLYAAQQLKIESFPKEAIHVTMPDGAVQEGVSFKTTPMEIIKKISNSLANKAVISKVRYSSRVATLD